MLECSQRKEIFKQDRSERVSISINERINTKKVGKYLQNNTQREWWLQTRKVLSSNQHRRKGVHRVTDPVSLTIQYYSFMDLPIPVWNLSWRSLPQGVLWKLTHPLYVQFRKKKKLHLYVCLRENDIVDIKVTIRIRYRSWGNVFFLATVGNGKFLRVVYNSLGFSYE